MTMENSTAGAVRELAAFAAELTWDTVPEEVRQSVGWYFLDAMATATYGAGHPRSRALARWARHTFGTGPCHFLGQLGDGLPPSAAAFLNAFAGRSDTFDDTHEGAVIHPGVPLFMAGLAVAEARGSTGRELLTAVIAGYEVAIRLAEAVMPTHYDRGFHTTGTFNALGAATVAAKLLGASPDQLFGAVNLAVEHAAGVRQYQLDGDICLSALHGARASQLGCESAELVYSLGFPYSPRAVDGQLGLWAATAGVPDNPSIILTDLGRQFRIIQTGIKPYPSCRYVHGAVTAILECMAQERIEAADVERIHVETFQLAAHECNRPVVRTVNDAQFSIQYNLARILVKGQLTPDDFSPETVAEFRNSPLLQKIIVSEAKDLTARYPAEWPYRATVIARSGRRFVKEVPYPLGAPEKPLKPQDIRGKAENLLARRVTDPVTAVERCLAVSQEPDIAKFVQAILRDLKG